MLIVVWNDVPIEEHHSIVRLSRDAEAKLRAIADRALEGPSAVADTSAAIAEVIAAEVPAPAGVIIPPTVAPWAFRATCSALEARGFVPLVSQDGRFVRV